MIARRLVLLAALWTLGCQAPASPPPPSDQVNVAGSTALLPLVTAVANSFMRQHPEHVVEVSPGGSSAGIEAVATGMVTIGMSDVPARSEVAAELVDHPVALVGLAAMAHRGDYNANVDSVTRGQLAAVFRGETTDWSELGGDPFPIVVVHRRRGSGTRKAFRRLLLGDEDFAGGGLELESSGQVQTTLLSTPGAISYLAFSYAHPKLKLLSVDGAAPVNAEIAAGRYPLWAREHLYTKGPADGSAREFLDYVQSPHVQDEIVPRYGFLSSSLAPPEGRGAAATRHGGLERP